MLAACSSAKPTPAPPSLPCPGDLTMPKPGHCTLATVCSIGDGMCFCTGHMGGEDRADGDESHWECGKQRHRSDGCPDDVAAGKPCTGDRVCSEVEDMCYAPHRCVAGTWGAIDNALCPKRP